MCLSFCDPKDPSPFGYHLCIHMSGWLYVNLNSIVSNNMPTLRGRRMPTYNFAKFSEKLHAIGKTFGHSGVCTRGRPLRSAIALESMFYLKEQLTQMAIDMSFYATHHRFL